MTNATTTSIRDNYYPLANIPFPAVTICNHNRITRSKALALSEQLKLPPGISKDDLLEGLQLLADISDPEMLNSHKIQTTQRIFEENGLTANAVLKQLGQSCEDFLEKCQWQGETKNCTELFRPANAYLGFCCSFNYPENYTNHPSIHTSLFGQSMGLNVVVNPKSEDYYSASFLSAGIMVLLHDPETYPDTSSEKKNIPIGKEAFITINAIAHKTDEEVRNLVSSIRRCYFKDERQLLFFKDYQDRNCVVECKINYSLKLCSCIPYFYPNLSNQTVCDFKHAICRHQHFYKFNTRKPGCNDEVEILINDYIDETIKMDDFDNAMSCNCPCSCNRIEYDSSISYGEFRPINGSINFFPGADTNFTRRILVHVYMESNFIQLLSTEVSIGISVLLSYLGGTTCIFLGCSFVTLVEVIYYFTIRFVEGYKRQCN